MIIRAIETPRVSPRSHTLTDLLDESVVELPRGSVLAVSSKIVALCEGSVVPLVDADKEELIKREADQYPEGFPGKYGVHVTIKHHTLISAAGVDESNAGDVYVLWPRDPQKSANEIRAYLCNRFGHDELGVIITDSVSRPMRRGASGMAIGFSGLKPIHNYVGEPDLFGRPFKVEHADIAGGLAAAAVLAMGEGAESTPLVLISDVPQVELVARDPTEEELAETQISLEDDLYAPFWLSLPWRKGGAGRNEV